MIRLILVRNPIQPDRREKYSAEHHPMMTVQGYIAPLLADWPDTEFSVSINGHILEKAEWAALTPQDGDQLVLMPVMGKGLNDFLRTVATMMLMAYVMGPNFLPNSGWVRPFLQAGAAYVGGRIINAVLPIKQPDLNAKNDYDASTTYSWGGAQVSEVPGTPVGKTFGTVQPELKLLMRHVSTDGSDQYLNLLYSAGEGPVDSVDDIKIDKNLIANYDNAQYWVRLGTNDQEPIEAFDATYSDYGLSVALDNDSAWHTQVTEGNAIEGLEIMFNLPNGLYYLRDDSSLGSASVTVEAQYKLSSESEWTDWISETISGAQNSAIYKTFRVDNLPAGQYDVRTRCTGKSGTSSRYATSLYWVQFSEIIYDSFSYPGKVLIGVKIKATDQLSGSDPKATCTVTRSKVWVWNPYTEAYEQQRASNPFWAAYDLIHNCKLLRNIQTGEDEYTVRGNPARRIEYDKFKFHGDYADELLPSGKYRFELNLFLESNLTFWDALTRIAMVGRGVVLPRGTKFSCICDRPGDVVQLFSIGNTRKAAGEFIGSKDRAKSVEAVFWNRDKAYEQDRAIYYSDEFNDDAMVPNPVTQTYYGITDYEHAYLEAAFLGRCNEFKARTETWEADIDAITCIPGDIVARQSDVTMWGMAGGRLVSATATTVTLDKAVDLIAGTAYSIMIRLDDDTLITKAVQTVAEDTTTATLTMIEPFATAPDAYDVYAFGGTNIVAKPFRVVSITKSGDQQCKLAGEEYFEAIYSDDIDVPVINYSAFTVKNLAVSVTEALPRPTDGTANISVSWIWPRDYRVAKAIIYAGKTSTVLEKMATAGLGTLSGTVLNVNSGETWHVKVAVVDELEQAIAIGTSSLAVEAQTINALASFRVSVSGANVVFNWSGLADNALGVEIRRGSSFSSGQLAARVTREALQATDTALLGDTMYWAAAYNKSGYSEALGDSISIDAISDRVAVLDSDDYQVAAIVTGDGSLLGQTIVQNSLVPYDDIKDKTYDELKDRNLMLGTGTGIVVAGAVINLGKLADVVITPRERWVVAPDRPVTYEIQTSTDGSAYSDWKLLPTGKISTQYIKLRAAVNGQNTVGLLRGIDFKITAEKRIVEFIDVAIDVGGTDVTFSPEYVNKPAIAVSANGAIRKIHKSNESRSGCKVQLLDDSGTDVGGVADVIVSGF